MGMNGEDGATRFVPAKPEFSEAAARLLHMSMRPLTEYWMGLDDTEAALAALRRLFAAKHNLFSHEFAECAAAGGETAGLVLDYPARTMKNLEPATLLKYLDAVGIVNTARMVWRSLPLQSITDATPDEYFLAHIAVLPAFEGRGLGRAMLGRSERRAREAGFRRITLTVDADNPRAIELYSRAGWEITSTVRMERLRKRLGYGGYHHMAKQLS